MKAIVHQRYGSPDVLQLQEVDKPSPADDEVLIRIFATTVTSGDWRVRSLQMPAGFGLIARLVFGIRRPRQPILGVELAGEVEAVGKGVTRFQVGDPVFGTSGARMGCHAEYKTLSQDAALALKPTNLGFDAAAALCFGGLTALDFLRRANIRPGDEVLINGASGAVGTAAIQLARYFGARVTGVCSTANLELVRSIGADEVIDYTQVDFTENGKRYDIIMDTAGTAPWSRCKRSLAEGGRLLAVLGSLAALLQAPWVTATTNKRVIAGPSGERQEDVRFLAELAEAGKFMPVIDRRYPFEQMADAHRYVDSGRKKGNVVVTLADSLGQQAAPLGLHAAG